ALVVLVLLLVARGRVVLLLLALLVLGGLLGGGRLPPPGPHERFVDHDRARAALALGGAVVGREVVERVLAQRDLREPEAPLRQRGGRAPARDQVGAVPEPGLVACLHRL